MLPSASAHYEARLDALRAQLSEQADALRIDNDTMRRVYDLAGSPAYKDHPVVTSLSAKGPLMLHQLATFMYGAEFDRLRALNQRLEANVQQLGQMLVDARERECAANARAATERRAQQDLLDRIHTSACTALTGAKDKEIVLGMLEQVRLVLFPGIQP